MRTININVPTRGNISNYDIARAIENRREQLENKRIEYPEIEHHEVPMKNNRGTEHSFWGKIVVASMKYTP